jgi:DNA-binding NtrC family response regulator
MTNTHKASGINMSRLHQEPLEASLRKVEERGRDQDLHAGLGDLVGTSPAMRQIFSLIRQVAPTSAPVLICGESGTGKDLVAREVHRCSSRAEGPFIAVNAAALAEALIESELFGHEKGAFTGAVERSAGCFEQAQGGTLFLDEIGEMPYNTQPKLLRVLEDLRIRRLGGKTDIPVDARVLAATSQDIGTHLREELYYRLSVFQIVVPPLRERKEDILAIANLMLRTLNQKHGTGVTGLDTAVLELLHGYDWPGNVRELRNVLERAVIVAGSGLIRLTEIPSPRAGPGTRPVHPAVARSWRSNGVAARCSPHETGRWLRWRQPQNRRGNVGNQPEDAAESDRRTARRGENGLRELVNIMDVSQIIAELLSERQRLDEAILALEKVSMSGPKKRGRPRKWVTDIGEPRFYETGGNGTSQRPAKMPGPGDEPS